MCMKHFIERLKLTEVHKIFCEMFKSDNLKLWVFSDECTLEILKVHRYFLIKLKHPYDMGEQIKTIFF